MNMHVEKTARGVSDFSANLTPIGKRICSRDWVAWHLDDHIWSTASITYRGVHTQNFLGAGNFSSVSADGYRLSLLPKQHR